MAFGGELDSYVPNNPDGRAWVAEAFRVCFEEFPHDCLTVAVLAQKIGVEEVGGGDIVAYARYIVPTKEVWENMYSYPRAMGEMSQEKLDGFLRALESQHGQVMGWTNGETGREHLWLENLATHPDHRRRGIGRALVGYICQLADATAAEVYLDASDSGMGLYERFGFVQAEEAGNRAASAPMIRGKRNGGVS
ncbi:hypothetical protein ABW20_dc0108693 [Dactylellina cionopaga]|nr:hypothetical protein ABW20_dc0108693 [Dactylellina cionopaga]